MNNIENQSVGVEESRIGGRPRKNKGASSLLKGVAIGVAGLGALAVIALVVVGYRMGWGEGAEEAVRKTLDLPAAKVNSTPISYADFSSDLESARHFFASSSNSTGTVPSDEELRQGVMDRLINQAIVAQEAKRFGVSVSQEEIDAEFQKLADAEGGDPAGQIQDLYGWTVDEFKEKVMKYYILEGKIAEALASDPDVVAVTEKRAQEALDKLNGGGDFAALAEEYSDDPGSKSKGGDLGSFGRGIMVGPFEDAAFALAPGERSGLVKTNYGIHIIEVTDNAKGDDGEVSEVTARHILIAFQSIDDYLLKKTQEATIEKMIE